jgi:hypothetical protein
MRNAVAQGKLPSRLLKSRASTLITTVQNTLKQVARHARRDALRYQIEHLCGIDKFSVMKHVLDAGIATNGTENVST